MHHKTQDGLLLVPQDFDKDGPSVERKRSVLAKLKDMPRRIAVSYREARKTISGQIKLTAGLAAAMLVTIGAIVSFTFWQVSERSEANSVLAMGALASAELTASISETRYHTARYVETGSAEDIAKAHDHLAVAKERLERTIETSKNSSLGELEEVSWLRAQVEGFELEVDALRNAVFAGNGAAVGALSEAIGNSSQILADHARDFEAQFVARSEASNADLIASNWYLTLLMLSTALVGIVCAIVGARFYIRQFADPIREITQSMLAIADGDETAHIPGAQRSDEIGAMATSLSVFREKANEVVKLEQDVAAASKRELDQRERVEAEKREALARFADQFENGMNGVVGHVTSASQQLHETANSMAASAGSASELSREVALSMEETTTGVTSAATASGQFAHSIEEIGRQAARSALIARDASINAVSADKEIELLRDTSDQANKLIELINSIAQRTDLLALNASIEAARGGEAGRGFAVVASEVKELAHQTQTVTDEVSRQINAIQNSTALSVAALKEIAQQIEEMAVNASSIAEAVDAQTHASRDLAANIDRAAAGSNTLSKQFGLVTEIALANRQTAQKLVGAAGGLQSQAEALDSQVNQFAEKVRFG